MTMRHEQATCTEQEGDTIDDIVQCVFCVMREAAADDHVPIEGVLQMLTLTIFEAFHNMGYSKNDVLAMTDDYMDTVVRMKRLNDLVSRFLARED